MSEPKKKYTFSQKWGDDPFTLMGHAQIPSALIRYAARLTITPPEAWLICCILEFKYTPGNDGPTQERLAEFFGQSTETIRRLLRSLETKNLLTVTRKRGDMGWYTHTEYDFSKLRACLNECYYQDHPQERPKRMPSPPMPISQEPITQYRGVVKTQKLAQQKPGGHPTDSAEATPRGRVDSIESFQESIESIEGDPASLFAEEKIPEEPPVPQRSRIGHANLTLEGLVEECRLFGRDETLQRMRNHIDVRRSEEVSSSELHKMERVFDRVVIKSLKYARPIPSPVVKVDDIEPEDDGADVADVRAAVQASLGI